MEIIKKRDIKNNLNKIVEALKKGGLVIMPTETLQNDKRALIIPR